MVRSVHLYGLSAVDRFDPDHRNPTDGRLSDRKIGGEFAMTYIQETFGMIKDAFAFGYNTLSTVLQSIGISIQIFFLMIVGFTVVGMVLSTVMTYFRGSADSSVNLAKKAYYKSQNNQKHTKAGKDG